jgi:plastocyanin
VTRVSSLHPRSSLRGSVLVWLALMIFVLLGFVGLGVDIGKAVATMAQLQNAADAAALAAASAIDSTSGNVVPGEATARAQIMAADNQAFEEGPTPVIVDAGDVVVFTGANGRQQVTVTTRRDGAHPMITNFARVIGRLQFALRASATAQVERVSGVCDLLPMGAQALQARFGTDSDQRTNICYSDYHGNGARIVSVSIVTPFGKGKSPVTITGFAGFFLRDLPGKGNSATINGELLYLTTPGIGGGTGTGPGIFTVNLVQ